MGRRRTTNVKFPKGVFPVRNRVGVEYWFFQEGRGTKHAGPRIGLGRDTSDPDFWRRLREARGQGKAIAEGTMAALIAAFRKHKVDKMESAATRRGYTYFLDRIGAMAGDRRVDALARSDVYTLQDQLSDTPTTANYMIAVLRTTLEFGVKHGYRADNPAVGIERLKVDDGGHAPWPEAGYQFVKDHAPVYLSRMAFLGRATGQRRSDLVKMRPADLTADGINVRIQKLGGKLHMVPLTKAQMVEIKSWPVRDLQFFITSPTGKKVSANYLNELWNDWRASEAAKPIREMKMTIHGLRSTAINDRRREGATDGGIADELCMSVKMVSRYLRFADKVASGRASRDRREQKQAEFANTPTDLQTHRR